MALVWLFKMIRVFIIIFLFIAFITLAKIYLQPFQISDDLAIESSYKKRLEVNPKDTFFPSLIRYTSESAKLLNSVKEKDLLGFRCSDSFIRTNQGVYILENVKTSKKDKKRLKNQPFIEFMRNKEKQMPKGKRILTARVCEMENKTMLIFYSIGIYNSKSADNTPIFQTILNSVYNDAFVQIIPRLPSLRLGFSGQAKNILIRSRTFTIARSNGHLRCDEPFQLGTNNLLYVLCDEQQSKSANYFIYEVNLNTGITRLLRRCVNNFIDKLKTVCN